MASAAQNTSALQQKFLHFLDSWSNNDDSERSVRRIVDVSPRLLESSRNKFHEIFLESIRNKFYAGTSSTEQNTTKRRVVPRSTDDYGVRGDAVARVQTSEVVQIYFAALQGRDMGPWTLPWNREL
eukprot:2431558-Pyramimonas_sp.AAC.1